MIKSLDLGLGIFLVLNHGSLEKLFLVGEPKSRILCTQILKLI